MMAREIKEIRVDRNRLNVIMQDRGITNVELARRMKVHKNAIVRIKKEQSTSLSGLTDLCAALNCHPFDLMIAEGFPDPLVDAPPTLVAAC
jgi:DNA-binding Xre family transcriptional regulator